MNDRQLAIVVNNENTGVTIIETIDAIKKAGFQHVFIQWYNEDWTYSQEEQLKYIRENNLNVIFAHLGYQNINDIWLESEIGDRLVERYKDDIKICGENKIPMVIMHLTSKKIAPPYNEKGLKRLQKIADYAQCLGVNVAFENTKIKGYLDYVIDNIDNDNVGICLDSGHYHVHFDDDFNFAKFKGRIFAVHLHDNDKSDDLHLIPFDGTLDWDDLVKKLKDSNYSGPITMEQCYRYQYLETGIDNFMKKSYEVGKKLQKMFKN